jgi:hypothetical protein
VPVDPQPPTRAHPPGQAIGLANLAAVGQRAGADTLVRVWASRTPWPWLAALVEALAWAVAALCARTTDACGRVRRATWRTTLLVELAVALGRAAGALGAWRGRGRTLLPGRLFRRAPGPAAISDAAVTDITTDDVDAAAQSLVGAGATWVGAVQVGGDRCVMLRTAGGQVVRLFRAHRLPDQDGRTSAATGDGSAVNLLQAAVSELPPWGWDPGPRRAREPAGAAAPGANLPGALVLTLCGLACLVIVTGTEDMLRLPRPAADPGPTDRVAVAVAAPDPSPPPAHPSGPDRVLVAGTELQGVNVRAAPSAHAAPVKLAPEGAVLEVVGTDRAADGRTWRNVRDPGDGAHGWVAAEFLAAGPP